MRDVDVWIVTDVVVVRCRGSFFTRSWPGLACYSAGLSTRIIWKRAFPERSSNARFYTNISDHAPDWVWRLQGVGARTRDDSWESAGRRDRFSCAFGAGQLYPQHD